MLTVDSHRSQRKHCVESRCRRVETKTNGCSRTKERIDRRKRSVERTGESETKCTHCENSNGKTCNRREGKRGMPYAFRSNSFSISLRYIFQLQNEKSKTAILQTESEKSKRNVEIKEMDLVVWKKRHDNIVAEKVSEFSK